MRWSVTGALWTACLAIAIPAPAQTDHGPWASARLIADADKSWNIPVPSESAGGISAGFELSRRIGFELAVDWPTARTVETVRFYQDITGRYRTTERDSYQSPGGIGFVTIRALSRSRFRLTVLAGLGFVSHRASYDHLNEHLDPSGNVLSSTTGGVQGAFPWGGPAFGVETPIRLGTHVAVVPEIHIIWFPIADTGPSTTIVRPAIGVRWTF